MITGCYAVCPKTWDILRVKLQSEKHIIQNELLR